MPCTSDETRASQKFLVQPPSQPVRCDRAASRSGSAAFLQPSAPLIQDEDGYLYGTTSSGGVTNPVCQELGCGAAFQIDPRAGTESTIHIFTGGADGGNPSGGLLVDTQGNGTTFSGGSAPFGFCLFNGGDDCGVVYKFDSAGNETVLWNFTGGSDGASSSAGVTMDQQGNLYGTTNYGGDPSCFPPYGCGVVFKLTP